jgi:hypothetical protein
MDKKSKYFEALAVAVSGGSTIRSASESAGCSYSHAYHISSTTDFRQRVSEIRSEVAAATVGLLTDGARQAAATVVSLLDQANDPGVRLNAAKAIFAAVGPATDMGELRQRLDALEQAQKTKLGITG